MKNLILFIISSLILISCEENKNPFAFDSKTLENKYYNNQVLDFKIENKESKSISKIQYFLDEKEIKLPYNLENETLGNKTLKAVISYENKTQTLETNFELYHSTDPKPITFASLPSNN